MEYDMNTETQKHIHTLKRRKKSYQQRKLWYKKENQYWIKMMILFSSKHLSKCNTYVFLFIPHKTPNKLGYIIPIL